METVELAYVEYTGEATAKAADKHGIQLCVVKRAEAERDFIILPRCWLVERSFAWAAPSLSKFRVRAMKLAHKEKLPASPN